MVSKEYCGYCNAFYEEDFKGKYYTICPKCGNKRYLTNSERNYIRRRLKDEERTR